MGQGGVIVAKNGGTDCRQTQNKNNSNGVVDKQHTYDVVSSYHLKVTEINQLSSSMFSTHSSLTERASTKDAWIWRFGDTNVCPE